MIRPPRRVVVAEQLVDTYRLTPADNGAPFTAFDIAALATSAALLPRATSREVWVKRAQFPDFVAMAEYAGCVVQVMKRGGRR